jgi:serine/threonine-protein kinase
MGTGRYEILGKLGEGAMGVVYRAQDIALGRVVALKMLSTDVGADREQRQRFLREAEAVGRLSHPNIVQVYDLGELDGHLYMAMELLEGEDLRALIERQSDIPVVERIGVMEAICDGLGYAHSKGVVHRDIKPANLLVTRDGRVKILDFGLARVAERQTITRRGVILGTPDYMSPEQAMGKTVDPRSDIFSVGGVFYEFLTLQKPFRGKTLHSVLYQIISEEAEPVLTLNPDVPARLAAVVHRMLQKLPDKRYASLEEVRRDLGEISSALRRSHARSAAPLRPPAPPPAAPGPSEEVRARAREHVSRGRAHYDGGQFARALFEVKEALALDPSNPDAAELLWRAGKRIQEGAPSRAS